MKILLISPRTFPEKKTPSGLMIPQLALHIIKGHTPSEHEVTIIEEENEQLNPEEQCDLVGISCMTSNAPRAYDIAAEFRKRGKKVILGGVHPTILPNEALQYADSIVAGEAEGVWESILEDFKNNTMKRIYHHPFPSLDRRIVMKNRRESKRRLFDVIPIMTTRGCPYSCEFCSVSIMYGKKIRHVPIDNVVHDIEESRGKKFIFTR